MPRWGPPCPASRITSQLFGVPRTTVCTTGSWRQPRRRIPRAGAARKEEGEREELTKRLGTEERGREPTRGGWEARPLGATSGAPGPIASPGASRPEPPNPPRSERRATCGSLGQLHPVALPPRPATPEPGRIRTRGGPRGAGREGAPRPLRRRRPGQREGLPQAGPGPRSLALSPALPHLRLSPHGPPLRGCPKPRPGHAPKSRPRLRRGPLGREPDHKQNLRRPTRGGAPGLARTGGVQPGSTGGGAAREGGTAGWGREEGG